VFDCDGNCVIGEDCEGLCGGISLNDECGVCNGQDINNDEKCQTDIDILNEISLLNHDIDNYENNNSILHVWNQEQPYYLTSLTLTNISGLPLTIGDFSGLEQFILSDNSLVAIPNTIVNLSSLSILWLDRNNLISLPSTLCNLSPEVEDISEDEAEDDDSEEDLIQNCSIDVSGNNLCEAYHFDCIDVWEDQGNGDLQDQTQTSIQSK
jgi:hypothetical protein